MPKEYEKEPTLIIGDYRDTNILGQRQNFDKDGKMVLGSQKDRYMDRDLQAKKNQEAKDKKKSRLDKMYPTNKEKK